MKMMETIPQPATTNKPLIYRSQPPPPDPVKCFNCNVERRGSKITTTTMTKANNNTTDGHEGHGGGGEGGAETATATIATHFRSLNCKLKDTHFMTSDAIRLIFNLPPPPPQAPPTPTPTTYFTGTRTTDTGIDDELSSSMLCPRCYRLLQKMGRAFEKLQKDKEEFLASTSGESTASAIINRSRLQHSMKIETQLVEEPCFYQYQPSGGTSAPLPPSAAPPPKKEQRNVTRQLKMFMGNQRKKITLRKTLAAIVRKEMGALIETGLFREDPSPGRLEYEEQHADLEKLFDELRYKLKSKAPITLAFLNGLCHTRADNDQITYLTVSILSIGALAKNRSCLRLQKLVGLALRKTGGSRRAFNLFQKLGLSTSFLSTRDLEKKLLKDYDQVLGNWEPQPPVLIDVPQPPLAPLPSSMEVEINDSVIVKVDDPTSSASNCSIKSGEVEEDLVIGRRSPNCKAATTNTKRKAATTAAPPAQKSSPKKKRLAAEAGLAGPRRPMTPAAKSKSKRLSQAKWKKKKKQKPVTKAYRQMLENFELAIDHCVRGGTDDVVESGSGGSGAGAVPSTPPPPACHGSPVTRSRRARSKATAVSK